MRNRYILRDCPRLRAFMKQAALLCDSEANCAIQSHRAGYFGSCEAVDHFGGNLAVIRHAIRWRHHYRRQDARRLAA